MAVMDTTQRRVVYGLNVALQIVIAAGLLAGMIYASTRVGGQVDLTSSGVNSLSPRTVNLLKNLKEDLRVTAIYTVLSEYDKKAQKRQDQVRDLLTLYESAAGSKLTAKVIDPMKNQAEVPALLKRLQEKSAFKDEAKPHQEALTNFPPLNDQLASAAGGDYDKMFEIAQKSEALNTNRAFVVIASNLKRIARDCGDVKADIQELTQNEVPRYGRAIERVRTHVTAITPMLQEAADWLKGDGKQISGLPAEVAAFFDEAAARYQPIVTQLTALTTAIKDLKAVKLEETYEGLSRWSQAPPILVESESDARILSFQDVFPFRTDEMAAGSDDDRDFAGEQAVSSAVLQLTQKEKTGVIFVRCGGQPMLRPDFSNFNPMMRQMPRAPYQGLNEELTKANFEVEEWDAAASQTPPEIKDAKRIVYVVFPPEPPQQQDPRRPAPPGMSPEAKQAILNAVGASGMVFFVAGWQPPSMPFGPSSSTYEFSDYLKSTWGIEVKSNFLAFRFTVSPENASLKVPQSRDGTIDTDHLKFTDHPIGKPLQALPGALQTVCPLGIVTGDAAPKGVKVEPIIEVKNSEDIWAFDDINRIRDDLQKQRGTLPAPTDLRAPFPVALAATNEGGQKLVVIASETFAADQITQAMGMQPTSSGIAMFRLFPANTDLFLNTINWLTGDADRIAVGPRKAEFPRLDKLKEGPALTACRFVFVGGLPGLALLVGGVVWLFRRR
ncbi:ABC-type uncharacterized transport system [Phycisphaerae bacterium RAS1]|nr:ABC-type uncharacterized transport system [Phycisphaerae bacterium RAS1]